ncbi:MAG: glycosyltransferase family 4 protein, partial [Arachnia sp.]
LRERHDFVLVAVTYPHRWRTGSEYVRSRADAYAAAGLRGVVVDYSPLNVAEPHMESDTTPVAVIRPTDLPAALEAIAAAGSPVLAHSPTPQALDELHARIPGERLAVWFHGYEVRDYRRLQCNATTEELFAIRHIRDAQNRDRFRAAAPVFTDPAVTKVFVSDIQRQYSEFDVGVAATRVEVIPNHIDEDTYRARERRPDEARRILLMRGFAQRNYANDVALRALEICSRRDGFSDLEITVRGYGRHFRSEVAAVRAFDNVTVTEGFSSPAQMAALHDAHGVFLCPTRYDTQGVMLGEAMASGMATITNPVAAIPEFTDDTCSLLPRGNDPWAFADALWELVQDPGRLPSLSRNAAERVRRQCGTAATIDREIELIRGLTP